MLVSELELVKLPEDMTLAGFTPLMSNPQDPCYAEKNEDMVNLYGLNIVKKREESKKICGYFSLRGKSKEEIKLFVTLTFDIIDFDVSDTSRIVFDESV